MTNEELKKLREEQESVAQQYQSIELFGLSLTKFVSGTYFFSQNTLYKPVFDKHFFEGLEA